MTDLRHGRGLYTPAEEVVRSPSPKGSGGGDSSVCDEDPHPPLSKEDAKAPPQDSSRA